jgi:hypothetical protein
MTAFLPFAVLAQQDSGPPASVIVGALMVLGFIGVVIMIYRHRDPPKKYTLAGVNDTPSTPAQPTPPEPTQQAPQPTPQTDPPATCPAIQEERRRMRAKYLMAASLCVLAVGVVLIGWSLYRESSSDGVVVTFSAEAIQGAKPVGTFRLNTGFNEDRVREARSIAEEHGGNLVFIEGQFAQVFRR